MTSASLPAKLVQRIEKLGRSLRKLPSKVQASFGGDAPQSGTFEAFRHSGVVHDAPLGQRKHLIARAQAADNVLEIGPYHNPALHGPQVRYFEIFDTETLKTELAARGMQADRAPDIHYVSPTGDLSVVSDRFEAVFSAHCVEHQPDLIRHLEQVWSLLQPGGCYYLICPDTRYCHDHFIPISTVGDVIEAHYESRKVHRLGALIDSRALRTHNRKEDHWAGKSGTLPARDERRKAVAEAIAEWRASNGAYINTHAWQFTPDTFLSIIETLNDLDLVPLKPLEVHETRRLSHEFTAILGRVA